MATDRLVPSQYSTIQAAVDAADEYDTILVYPGVYREEVEIEKPLTLMAKRGRPIIEAPFGENVNAIWIGASDVTVTGFQLKASDDIVDINPYNLSAGQRIENVVIENNHIAPGQSVYDPNAPGIFACRVDNLTVQNNTIRNTGGVGIYLGLPGWPNADVINSLIEGNQVLNSGYTGILVVWGSNNYIVDNRVQSAGSHAHADDGIRLGLAATNNFVENNRVHASTNDGIIARPPASGNTIRYNVSLGNAVFDINDWDSPPSDNIWQYNKYRTVGGSATE